MSTARRSHASINAAADAVCALLNNGYLRIYDGTQPANADTAITTQTLLAELRFGSPAFAACDNDNGATANSITDGEVLSASTATWFRAFEDDGTTVVYDGKVDDTTGELVLSKVSLALGGSVHINSMVYYHLMT